MKNLLDIIKNVTDEYGFGSLKKEIVSIENLLAEDSIINIVVLGQFKAGKSSLINSLIGLDILPVGVIPVTSVITLIQYATEQKVTVCKSSGDELNISIEEIPLYVSESQNPENIKKILFVKIETPLLNKYPVIRLIDTPGLNSIFKTDTLTAKSTFTDIGAGLVTISAERPLSENDVELISEITAYTPGISIILTKTDLYNNEQLIEIAGFIKLSLYNKFMKNFKIYYYSIYSDTEKNKNIIEREVLNIYSEQFERERKKILQYKIKNITANCLSYLEIAHKSALKTEEERKTARTIVLDEKTGLGIIRKELRLITSSYINSTRTILQNYFEKYIYIIAAELVEQLQKDYITWSGNIKKVTEQYAAWINTNLRQKIIESFNKEYDNINSITENSKNHFEHYVSSFREKLKNNLFHAYGVSVSGYEWKIDKRRTLNPDISITRIFDSPLELFWFMFPMLIKIFTG